MRPRILLLLALVAAPAFLACAQPNYAYAPVRTTSAELEGVPAADYPIPPESPHGEVKLAMLGVKPLTSRGLADSTLRAIHIALSVSNRSDETWTVDPSEQRVTLTVRRERSELYATSADVGRPQKVAVPAHSTRELELYFPLPIQLQKEGELPSFDVAWVVHAGSRVMAQRTVFQRFLVEPASPPPRTNPLDIRLPEQEIERSLPGSEPPERRLPWLAPDPLP